MEDLSQAAKRVAEFVQTLTTTGGMRLKYRITAGAGASDPDGLERRDIYVELAGPDATLMTDRNGEGLRALEHIAAKILRLEPEDHDRVSFDALGFKAERAAELRDTVEDAVERVRESGKPYSFRPMSSRERRMLHMVLSSYEDLRTESSGEGRDRFVVLYPGDYQGTIRPPRREGGFRGNRGGGRGGYGGRGGGGGGRGRRY